LLLSYLPVGRLIINLRPVNDTTDVMLNY
jgi:hypothetical protein